MPFEGMSLNTLALQLSVNDRWKLTKSLC